MAENNTQIASIDELGVVDSYFGLLSSVSAIREHTSDPNNHMFDVHEFLIKLRQNMAIQEAFCGSDHNKEKSALQHFTKPDFLLFEKGIDYSYLNEFMLDVFSNIQDKVCDHKNQDHSVTKSQPYLERMSIEENVLPYLDESVRSVIDENNIHFVDDITLVRFKAIPNPHEFKKRVEITNRISNILNGFNINEYIAKRKPRLDKAMLASFVNRYNLPLVGTIRAYPDQTVLYVMSHYKKYGKKERLVNISNYMDRLLPYVLKTHPRMQECIRNCSELCKNEKKEVIITKMLARKNGSSGICVIYFVVFLNDIKRGKQKLLPIRNLYDHFRKNQNDEWETYMGGYRRYDLK